LQELSGCSYLEKLEEISAPAAWMCYTRQVKLKKLNEGDILTFQSVIFFSLIIDSSVVSLLGDDRFV